jgi:hypothetical protein
MEVRDLQVVTKLNEEFNSWTYTGYPWYYVADGWTEYHSYERGFERSFTNKAGGTSPEARMVYYDAAYYQDTGMISPSINTLGEGKLELEFKSYIDHYYGSTYCWMTVEARADPGDPWTDYTPWSNPISGNVGPDTYLVDITPEIGVDTQVRFNFYGYYFYFDYWHVDDVKLISYTCGEEIYYKEKVCVDNIEVCEEQNVPFPDFIPEPPEPCYCGTVDYCVISYTKMLDPPDQNPANDRKQKFITVEFLHDVGIVEFTSPASIGTEILWDNGPDNGANGLSCMNWPEYPLDREVVDDFFNDETWTVTDGHFSGTTYYCSQPGDVRDVRVFFYEDIGNEPSLDRFAERLATTVDVTASGCELSYDVEFDPVVLPAGDWWVCFQPDFDDNGFWNTADGQGNSVYVAYPDAGFPKWTDGTAVFGTAYDVTFQLTGTIGGDDELPTPEVYIKCGEGDLSVLIENFGTYDESPVVVDWWLYEYQPAKTEVASGQYNTALDAGDQEDCYLGTYAFIPGVFELEAVVNLVPPSMDCNLANNGPETLIIGVDCCEPDACFVLDPEDPDGENNWYISPVTVTVDGWDTCEVQSGISHIVYIVDGVMNQIAGDHGDFVISGDGVHHAIIYAVDNVGHEGVHHTFEVAIDATDPNIDLVFNKYTDEAGTNFVEFTALAGDDTSGMNRVEFTIDGVLKYTEPGAGPYTFTVDWTGYDQNTQVCAIAYDDAGNDADDCESGIKFGKDRSQSQSRIKTLPVSRVILNLGR